MTLENALKDMGDFIIGDAKQNLKRMKKVSSGKLYRSMSYKIIGNDEWDKQLTFEFGAAEKYWQYVDQGTGPAAGHPVGKMIKPKSHGERSLKAWMKRKGIDLKYLYVIKRSIRDNGVKPTLFFTKAIENNDQELNEIISEFLEKQFTEIEDYMVN